MHPLCFGRYKALSWLTDVNRMAEMPEIKRGPLRKLPEVAGMRKNYIDCHKMH